MPSSKDTPTVRRPRRSQEERRRETRKRVLDACVDVIVDHGFGAVTTTTVAARAGVSRGAQAHYFPTREALVAAATEHLMEQGTAGAVAEADRARASSDPIAFFIADAERFFFDRIYVAMMELLVAARTDEALRRTYFPIVEAWREQINAIWLEVFESAGIERDRALLLLHLTNNMMRGLALTSIWDKAPETRAAVLDGWRALVHDIFPTASGNGPRD